LKLILKITYRCLALRPTYHETTIFGIAQVESQSYFSIHEVDAVNCQYD